MSTTEVALITARMTLQTHPSNSILNTLEPQGPLSLSRFNEGRFDLIIGYHVLSIMEMAIITILCGIISAFGIVANVLNILVFFRQGALSSSSNVSLLALTFADIGCLITVFSNSINYAMFYINKDLMPYLTPHDFTELFVLWPHIMFMQISSWITVYIALERCLCVVFPLKIKVIFNAKRSLFVVVAIAIIGTLSFVPIYATTTTEKIQDFYSNATKVIFSLNEEQFELVDISNAIQSIFLRVLAVATVFICTQITVYRVRMSTTWRKSIAVTNTTISGDVSNTSQVINNMPQEIINTDQPSKSFGITETSEISNTKMESNNDSTSFRPAQTKKVTKRNVQKTKIMNNSASTSSNSMKERRLIRIITVISTIFVVCNTPEIIGIFTLIAMEGLYGISPWDNLIHFIMYIQFLFESINASINILVYYNMSTRYKIEFRQMFGLD